MNLSLTSKNNKKKLLIIFMTLNAAIAFAADGFGGIVTGGAAGASVTVSNASDLSNYAASPSPYIITVSGTIVVAGNIQISSNKTIQGADSNSAINGNLYVGNGVKNVIIRNLNITNPTGVGDGDGITITGSRNVLVTHCTFTDCADGSCDIIRQADSVTISWCRFLYDKQTSHCYVNLIGNSDTYTADLGYLHVTIHHCWYDRNCVERMPSVRFGRVHVYNNYYNADSIKYGTRTRINAECLVENNYFENMQNPWELLTTTGTTGKLSAAGNNVAFMETSSDVNWVSGWYPGQSLIPGSDSVFTPPYPYTLSNVLDVKVDVMNGAGNKNHDIPVNVNRPPSTADGFSLFQNYPNPFNPSTTIRYALSPNPSPAGRGAGVRVLLKVYDPLGREVATLVDETKQPGIYEVNWNAAGMASGIYFYRLTAGKFGETKRLLLIK